ncbi:MAG: GC-type dockerin domain-anchored protein [Phycisphaerales bacterium]
MVSHATLALAQTWEELGPAPTSVSGGSAGRVSSIACSPTDPDLYYVGAADGGVWKTTDGGLNWTPLTDHMPTTAIGAVEIDPFDERIIYAGTGEANFANHSRYGLGLLRSMDAGATWELLAGETFAGRCFSRIVCDPATPGVLYASITRAGGFPELAAARGHPQAESPLGVFRSADRGETWTRLPGLPELSITDLAIDPFNASVLYAGVGRIFGSPDNGVYKSSDAGQTWTRLSGGLPTQELGRVTLAVSPDEPQTLVTLLTRPSSPTGGGAQSIGGYRSTDGGQTWSAYGTVSQSSYGWYLSVASIRPGAPGTVFYGGLLMNRQIGGQSASVTPPHVDIHAIEWDAAGRLLSGNDGGVHRSEDLGASWTNLNVGLGTIQFYAGVSTHPSDDDWFAGGTQDNGSSVRRNGNNSWSHVLGGDGGWTQTFLDGLGRVVVFAESQGTGNLSRSTNGGMSFQGAGGGLSGRNCFLPPYVVDPSDPQRLLYATERVFESTNGGTQWAALSGDLTAGGSAAIRALAIAPSDARFVYAATNDGRVLASGDSGATFDLVMEDHPGWPRVTRELTVHPTEPETVYLAASAFGADQVRRSRDAGLTWETLDGDLPDVPVNVVVADARCETEVLYAGTDSGVFRSLNGGRNWYRFGDGPNAVVIDLRLEVEGGRERLVIGTQGRGLWRAAVGGECWCRADQNGDGTLSNDDFFAYLSAYAAGDLAGADLTGSALPGVPGFGEPDGVLSGDDFFYYLGLYAAGC